MNRNKLSKDLDIMMKKLQELEEKHGVKMMKVYSALNAEKIEAIVNEAMEERMKNNARRDTENH